jgi:O-antigen/teichoic acid export membrane protein
MSVKKNVLANYLGTSVIALAPLLALPWYLSALGPAQYGLIGFMTLFQAVLGLLDAGMGQALVREIAVRFDVTHDARIKTAALLFGFERIYWLFAVLVGCLVWLFAGWISASWLNLGTVPQSAGRIAVEGAAAIFAAQFPGSVYRSLLVGAQAQVRLNAVMLAGALLKHGGAVVIVVIWPSLATYAIWHAVVALLETLTRRYLAWKLLGVESGQVTWNAAELRPVWRTVVSLSGAAMLGALTVQMDKIVLSRMATLEQFGFYTVASSVALGLLQFIYPLIQAVLPRAIQLRNEPAALRSLCLKLSGLIAAMVASGAVVFMLAGHWLLTIWLKNAQTVAAIYPLLMVLLAGTALNAFYNVGYIHWLVHDKVRRVLQVNVVSLMLAVTLVPWLVAWQGSVGATFGWLVMNLIGLLLSLEWLKRKPHEKNH